MTLHQKIGFALLLITAIPLFTSCQTAPRHQGKEATTLEELRDRAYPTFSAIGKIDVSGGGADFKGYLFLAMADGKYRMEVTAGTGQTISAMAWSDEKKITMNPATGEKKIVTGDHARVAGFGNFNVPVSFMRVMATSLAPSFEYVTSVTGSKLARKAKVVNPAMEITFSNVVTEVVVSDKNDESIVMNLGSLKNGGIAPYPESCKISLPERGVTALITWSRMEQGVNFPDGFFTFTDL